MGNPTLGIFICLMVTTFTNQAPMTVDTYVFQEEVETYITTGILLSVVEDSVVYTDQYEITFALPDYPELKLPPSELTCDRSGKTWCKSYSDIFDINSETIGVIGTAAKMFTVEGVPEQRSFNTISTTFDDDELQQPEVVKAGVDWYRNAKTSLSRRKAEIGQMGKIRSSRSTENITLSYKREKRNVLALFPKHLIWQAAKTFFFGKGNILQQLTRQRSLVPSLLRPLTDVAEFVSTLAQRITGSSFSTNLFESDFEQSVSGQNKAGASSLPSRNEEFKYTQVAIAQNSILTQQLTNLHLIESSMLSCRDGLLPLGFVPPQVLRHRLKELERDLDPEMTLVFPAIDAGVYYNLKYSTCKYDNDGGILGLKILLRPAKTTFQLYELRSLSYAWYDETCDMGIEPGLIVRDSFTGALYPITALDEMTCFKEELTICKLPQEANADLPRQHCLMTALGGGNSRQILNSCELTCRKGNRISYTQVDQDSIVVAHLPQTGSKVKCGSNVVNVTHNFQVGALKVTLGCGCQLELKSRVIAKSQRVICDVPLEPFTIRHILPIHMSVMNRDWVPFHNGNLLESKFTSRDVLDESWQPKRNVEGVSVDNNWISYKIPIVSLPFNLICCFSCLFFFYQNNILRIQVASLFVMSGMTTTEAARSDLVTCQTPADVYWLLGTILFLQGAAVAYFVYKIIMRKLKKLHNAYVQTQVTRAFANGTAEA